MITDQYIKIIFNISNVLTLIKSSLLIYLSKRTPMIPKLAHPKARQWPNNYHVSFADKRVPDQQSLYENLNQDNLNYMGTQVKQKKRLSPLYLSQGLKGMGNADDIIHNYIEQKPEKYESTSRQLVRDKSQMDQFVAKTENDNEGYLNSQSDALYHKQVPFPRLQLDLISQSKSKKFTSLGDHQVEFLEDVLDHDQEYSKSNSPNIVNFIDGYLHNLQREKLRIGRHRQSSMREEETNFLDSLWEQNAILIEGVKKQRKKNTALVKMIQQYQIKNNWDAQRISELQENLAILQVDIASLKAQNLSAQISKQKQIQAINRKQLARLNELQTQFMRFNHQGLTNFNRPHNH